MEHNASAGKEWEVVCSSSVSIFAAAVDARCAEISKQAPSPVTLTLWEVENVQYSVRGS